jgi:hypothetical protein
MYYLISIYSSRVTNLGSWLLALSLLAQKYKKISNLHIEFYKSFFLQQNAIGFLKKSVTFVRVSVQKNVARFLKCVTFFLGHCETL